jgi:hypothetical protein
VSIGDETRWVFKGTFLENLPSILISNLESISLYYGTNRTSSNVSPMEILFDW